MFVLDTDHLGIIQRRSEPGFSNLMRRMRQHTLEDFFVAIITFQEQFAGWNAYTQRARDSAHLVRGYAMFQNVLVDFATLNIRPFDPKAAQVFADLRRSGLRIGTMDLRIASIALAHRFTVLTRNSKDFEKVPDLLVEDWTLPPHPE